MLVLFSVSWIILLVSIFYFICSQKPGWNGERSSHVRLHGAGSGSVHLCRFFEWSAILRNHSVHGRHAQRGRWESARSAGHAVLQDGQFMSLCLSSVSLFTCPSVCFYFCLFEPWLLFLLSIMVISSFLDQKKWTILFDLSIILTFLVSFSPFFQDGRGKR